MASTTMYDLLAKVEVDTKGGVKSLTDLHGKLGETETHAKAASGGIAGFISAALPMAAVAGAGMLVANALHGMVDSALEANRGIAATDAVLKSTHGQAGMTAQGITDLATKLMRLDGVDDDVVRSGENMLLTFTNIGKKTFPEATAAVLDMATFMNDHMIPSAEQMAQTSIQVGKALNDPINGVTALRKVGVTLTDQQEKQIKTMMKHGNIAGAQGVILKELAKEFGGSAKAAGDAGGPMQKLTLMWGDMQKTIGNALLPALQSLATAVIPLVTWLGEMLPVAIAGASAAFAKLQVGMTFIATNGETVKSVLLALSIGIGVVVAPILAGLIPAFIAWAVAAGAAAVATIAATWPILAVAAGIALLVLGIKALVEHWTQITKATQNFANIAGAVLGQFFSSVGAWFQNLGVTIATWAVQTLGKISLFISSMLAYFGHLKDQAIATIINMVVGLVSQFISLELRGLGIIRDFIGNFIGAITGAVGRVASAAGSIASTILGALSGLGGRLAGLARSAIQAMISAILGMTGAVGRAVGDLFSGIGSHMPHFASGGISAGGFAMVGESGPELVALPAGSHVYPSGSGPSFGMRTGGGGGVIEIHVHTNLDGHELAHTVVPHIMQPMVDQIRRAIGGNHI